MSKAILYDATKCTACRGCQVACKQWNGLETEITTNTGTYENPPDLSSNTWLRIKFNEISRNGNGAIDWIFTRQACMHCTDAACVNNCPSGALSHNALGFVQFDKDKCAGCGYCVEFCPFSIPRAPCNRVTGVRKVDKCVFCADRVMNDELPACVKSCPTGALQFGNRDEMLAIGRRRVAQIKQTHPEANLYGADELGGLHVMYVLPHSPEVHGLPAHPSVSVFSSTHNIVQWMGVGGAVVLAAGMGLNLMVNRARKIHEMENH